MADTDSLQRPSVLGTDSERSADSQTTQPPAKTADDQPPLTPTKTADSMANNPQYITGLPFYVLFATLVLAGLLAALNASMLGTATPSITNTFHSLKDIGWYGASYLIANCAMMPLTGKIFSIFPLKWTFISFVAIFEIGALISGVSVNSPMLIVGRAISGVGGSGIITGATAVITVIRPMRKRPFLIGILMGGVALGQVAGPLIGGGLTEVTWRWIFYINLPLGGIVIFLFLFVARLPPSANPDRQESNIDVPGHPVSPVRRRYLRLRHQLAKIDGIGFVIFAAACALTLMGLEWGGTTYPWRSSQVIGIIVGGGIIFILFGIWSQKQGEHALLPLRLLHMGHINLFCGLTALTQSASVFILMYFLPIWFQGIKGASPVKSGVMLLPTILSQLLSAVLCGWLVQKTGYYLPEIIAGNALVAIASGLFTLFRPDTTAGRWIGFQIIGGFGRGFVMQLVRLLPPDFLVFLFKHGWLGCGISLTIQLITVIQANVPPKDSSLGISYIMFCQYFGGAVFICAARTILTSTLGTTLARYAPHVDPAIVINTGVTDFRKVIPSKDLPSVLMAYNMALVNVYYLQLALSGFAFVCCFFLGWKDVRKIHTSSAKKDDLEEGGEKPLAGAEKKESKETEKTS